MDGLSGWVKIPKGGKVKKGWKNIVLGVSDNKLYHYENMDDFNLDSGKLICDLACEIFVARSVSQNELIHANSQDIDSIFKIQQVSHDDAVVSSDQVCLSLI